MWSQWKCAVNLHSFYWLQKEVWLYVSIWKNDPTSQLIYDLTEQFLNEFIVSIAWLNASSKQPHTHFVNQGPVYSKVDDKVGFALGRGYFVTVWPPQLHPQFQIWLRLAPKNPRWWQNCRRGWVYTLLSLFIGLNWFLFIFVSRTQSAPTSWVYKTPEVQL